MRFIRSKQYSPLAGPAPARAVAGAFDAPAAGAILTPEFGIAKAVPENKYLSDEDVWGAFLSGEDAAYNMLYARYSDRLYVYLRFLLTATPRHLDDVFQETWITVFKQRTDPDELELTSFSGWLFRVAHNLAISELRKTSKSFLKTISIEEMDLDSELIEGFAIEATQDRELAPNSEEIMRHVMQAVEELPLLLREVFVLSEFDRSSLEEIAERLGISRTNAKVRLFRARRIIRERLTKVLDIT